MLTQEQQDLYSKIAKNPETFVIVAWNREDLRDMLREEDIEPSEKNVDFLLKANEFPAEDIQDKMIETGWDVLHDVYDGLINVIKEDLRCRKAVQKTNVTEQAARLRAYGEYHEDAAEWLDRWIADGWRSADIGTVEGREREVFDAILEANGLGQLPTTQCECLFSQAQEINDAFESILTRMHGVTVATAYSRTATYDDIIQHAAMLLKPDDDNGDPTGIHAEPALRFGSVNINGMHIDWEFDALKELHDLWWSDECPLPANDTPVTYATWKGEPIRLTTDKTFLGLLTELGIAKTK
ncbi:hypothetical protein PL960_09055 [Bifidobacterium adolescentis]|jgi:hypothetical protein|nr:hypothetical protein [Bifidobacterium adolescentis]MDB1502404.1 hypothetical protein [Bifidobacterium adolescentis]